MSAPRGSACRFGRVIVLAVAGLCPACSSQTAKLHPVRGKVSYLGKPAAGARIVFIPVNNADPTALHPTAVVAADGSFALSTPDVGEGAPAGEYGVAIVWTEPRGQGGEQSGDVHNRLPVRYADPKTSRLTARVQDGPTELPPFQLTK